MTSYERLLTAIKGDIPDRTPVVPEVFGVTAKISGYSIYEYVTDGKKMAESQLNARKAIGHDILFAFADLSVEAEAIGCPLVYQQDAYPTVKEHILKDANDIKEIKLPEPSKDGRMPVLLDACRILRETVKDECIIAASVMGPISIAAQIMGLENFLFQMVDDPDGINQVLDFAERVVIDYGKALIRAGAHCHVVFDPVASPLVIPPQFFIQYEVPRLRRMYEAFNAEGSQIFWISIAGNTKKILPYFKESGINIATVDYVVSLSEAFELGGGIALNGNIKPYCFVNCTPSEIKEEAKRCLLDAKGRVNYTIGSGCEVPIDSDIENIRAVVEVVEEFNPN